MTPPMRAFVGALRGDREAIVRLMSWSFERAGEQVEDLRDEIEARRAEWDADGARDVAMNGEVSAEYTEAALSEIYTDVVTVCALLPLLLTADAEAVDDLDHLLEQAALELIIDLHNPTIRYGIIGALRPEVREAGEEFVEQVGREVWGTARALTGTEEVAREDFPEDKRALLDELARSQEVADES